MSAGESASSISPAIPTLMTGRPASSAGSLETTTLGLTSENRRTASAGGETDPQPAMTAPSRQAASAETNQEGSFH